MNKKREKHIDEEQADTVDKHFQMIMEDNTDIDPEVCKKSPNDLPEWFDYQLFLKGQKYYQSNQLGMGLSGLAGLIVVLSIPTILKVLIWTKKSSTTCTGFVRYLETKLHINALYTGDIKDPKSTFYKSLNVIRWKHSTNSRRCGNSNSGTITQRDMVLTQFGFFGYSLTQPEALSLTNSPEERKALNHFWRVVGYLLGIPNSLNICRKSEKETTELCQKIVDDVYVKYLREKPENFLDMVYAALGGMKCVDILLDCDSFVMFTYKLNGIQFDKPISTYSWLNYQYRELILASIRLPILGTIARMYWNIFLTCSQWLVERYPIIAWLRFGVKNSQIKLYPHGTY